jgi:hypothetical protein
LGDISGKATIDSKLSMLMLTLTSVLMVNETRVINEKTISSLGNIIRTKQVLDNNGKNVPYPKLVFLLKDVQLDIVVNNQPATPAQYLEDKLRPSTHGSKESNEAREAIQSHLTDRDCVAFCHPTIDAVKLNELENLPSSDIDDAFEKSLQNLISIVCDQQNKKVIKGDGGGSIFVDGPQYIQITEMALAAINSSKAFVAMDVWDTVCQAQAKLLLDDAVALLRESLDPLRKLMPMQLRDLLRENDKIVERILFQFKDPFQSLGNIGRSHLDQLSEYMKTTRELEIENETESRRKCKQAASDALNSVTLLFQTYSENFRKISNMEKNDISRIQKNQKDIQNFIHKLSRPRNSLTDQFLQDYKIKALGPSISSIQKVTEETELRQFLTKSIQDLQLLALAETQKIQKLEHEKIEAERKEEELRVQIQRDEDKRREIEYSEKLRKQKIAAEKERIAQEEEARIQRQQWKERARQQQLQAERERQQALQQQREEEEKKRQQAQEEEKRRQRAYAVECSNRQYRQQRQDAAEQLALLILSAAIQQQRQQSFYSSFNNRPWY